MGIEGVSDREFMALTSRFPLSPIEDDDSYRAALEILDRLFELDDRRTRAELTYFQALARLAFDYEIRHDMVGSAS